MGNSYEKINYRKVIKGMDRVSVIKMVVEGGVRQRKAACNLGVSTRQVKRLVRRYRQSGCKGLIDGRGGSKPKYTEEFKAQVIAIVSSKYADFSPTFAQEKLNDVDKLYVNREALRQWMISASLWHGKKRKVRVIHQSRQRRPRIGELVQIDGSHHDWFEGRAPKCCLLVFIDDATSCIMQARFEEAETTLGYFRCVNGYLAKYGRPLAFYSDRYGVFIVNKVDSISGLRGITQFQRAMGELNIAMILANSPQAKGRVERANQTLQNRLVKEMRIRGISGIEQGNEYIDEFIRTHNAQYAVLPQSEEDAHRELEISQERLDYILSRHEERKLSKNLEVSYGNALYKIKRAGGGYSLRHAAVTVCEHMDARVTIHRGNETLLYEAISKDLREGLIADRKEVNAFLDKQTFEVAA
jgi:transposase